MKKLPILFPLLIVLFCFSCKKEKPIAVIDNKVPNWTIFYKNDSVRGIDNIEFTKNAIYINPNKYIDPINGGASKSILYKSSNLGKTWNLIPFDLNLRYTNFYFLDDYTGIIPLIWDDGYYRTIDAGITWTKYNTKIKNIYEVNSHLAIGYKDYILYKSTNKGLSWDTILTNNQMISSIDFINDKIGFYSDYRITSSPQHTFAHLFKTIDSGENWTLISSIEETMIRKMDFFDELHGIAVIALGSNYHAPFMIADIVYTSNGGISWNTVDLGKYNSHKDLCNDVYIHSLNEVYLGGDGIYFSTDFGLSWVKQLGVENCGNCLPINEIEIHEGKIYATTWQEIYYKDL